MAERRLERPDRPRCSIPEAREQNEWLPYKEKRPLPWLRIGWARKRSKWAPRDWVGMNELDVPGGIRPQIGQEDGFHEPAPRPPSLAIITHTRCPASEMSTFVLVHGTWHGGWCWKKLTPELEKLGHACFAPSLSVSSESGLSTHIQEIADLLESENLNEVILVGHSYGGMVITGVADRTKRVESWVYFDAIVPEPGESAFSLLGGLESQFRSNADAKGLVSPWSPEDFGVTDSKDVAWMKQLLRPFPMLTHQEKLIVSKKKAEQLARYFVYCTQFGMGGFAQKIRREGGTIFELDAGHDAMITEPKKLAVILDKIAQTP
jgi:pimeloyl-ACP methyl ester carboxylesterase